LAVLGRPATLERRAGDDFSRRDHELNVLLAAPRPPNVPSRAFE